jgi:pyrroline-5-carboxylate reductase
MSRENDAQIDGTNQADAGRDAFLKSMLVAGDIMNTDLKTLTMDHSVGACLRFMKVHRVRHAPVIDLPNENSDSLLFVGVISQRDVLRLNRQMNRSEDMENAEVDPKALRQKIGQVVARNPKSADLETPIPEVITMMIDNHIDIVPVLSGSTLKGIITTTDILKLFSKLDNVIRQLAPEAKKNMRPEELLSVCTGRAHFLLSLIHRPVEKIMTKEVICLGPEDNLAEAIDVMQAEKFRHIPVTDEQGELVGIVSDRDVLKHLPFAGKRPPKESEMFRSHLLNAEYDEFELRRKLGTIMTKSVTHVSPGCTAIEVAGLLSEMKIGGTGVVDGTTICGIVTTTDLMRVLLDVYSEDGSQYPIKAGQVHKEKAMGTIGFIGGGNMAQALVKGIISAKVYSPSEVIVSDVRSERLDHLASEYKITAAQSNAALVQKADVVVLSVKPQNMDSVLDEIKDAVKKDTLIVSIAAGVTTAKIAGVLGDVSIIRVMPNTPALLGEGASALYSSNASNEDLGLAQKIFSAVGKAVVVESEELIDAVTAVSGSGPAYFFLMMEEMINAGVKLGLSSDVAKELVLQTAKGAALLAESADIQGETPADLRKKVTSPGGTTEAAIKVLTEKQFGDMVTNALTAACNRSKELSG